MDKLQLVEKEIKDSIKKDYPNFKQADVIRVYYKFKEKDKERIHPFEGIVVKIQGEQHRKSFTIRRVAYGEAYEVTFPYYSPNIEKIELVKKSLKEPKRKRLYYLRKEISGESVM